MAFNMLRRFQRYAAAGASPRFERYALDHNAADERKIVELTVLIPVTKRARGDEDRIVQPNSGKLDGEIAQSKYTSSAEKTGPSLHTRWYSVEPSPLRMGTTQDRRAPTHSPSILPMRVVPEHIAFGHRSNRGELGYRSAGVNVVDFTRSQRGAPVRPSPTPGALNCHPP